MEQYIGKTIQTIRRQKRISQQQLAEMTGVVQASICAWERGKNEPKFFTAECLLEALGYKILIVPRSEDEQPDNKSRCR